MNWLKAIGLSIGTVISGCILAVQAFTNVVENDQPALAASVSPLNGFALERVALNRLADDSDRSLIPLVRQVLAKEPLSPAAWTILALEQEDDAKKDQILLAASKINRRTLLLQSNLLLLYAARNDFLNSIRVLNEILAVNPEQQTTLFPILIQALKDERSVPEFVQALSKDPSWSNSFLAAASQDRDALLNLLHVRMGLFGKAGVDYETDRAIIGALIKAGQIETAAALYSRISGQKTGDSFGAAGKSQQLDWDSKLPPFDWQLTDNSGVRAQIIEKPERLQLFVRSGKAGVLAQRLLAVPGSFSLEIKHTISPADQIGDLRVELRCEKSKQKVFDQPFTPSPSIYSIGPLPPDCAAVRLSLLARAWSDKADINGNIDSVAIKGR